MNIDFDEMAYPDTVIIGSEIFQANRKRNELFIPYTDLPQIKIGDTIRQPIGSSDVSLKIIDLSIRPGSTMQIGTKHPNLIIAKIENITAASHKEQKNNGSINIGALNAQQVQLGNNNTLSVTITIENLAKEIGRSTDDEAKGLLRKLLENNTVASLVGAGASALLTLL